MTMPQDSSEFARVFGERLGRFLDGRGMSLAEAARKIGLGPEGRARISAYCHKSPRRKRPKPNAELLYLLCSKLGFGFEYQGYKVTAEAMNGGRPKPLEQPIEQLRIVFDSQLNLTSQEGQFSMDVKRPPGRIEVSLALNSSKENKRG
jgi:transcriptional regulator with XRE-family HTH domain